MSFLGAMRWLSSPAAGWPLSYSLCAFSICPAPLLLAV